MRRPGSQPPKRLLTPTEKKALQRDIRELEIQLKTPDMVGIGQWIPGQPVVRSPETQKRLSLLRARLEEGSIEKMDRYTVQRWDKRIRELEERCAKRMVPRKFYFAKQDDTTDFNKTVAELERVEMSPQHQAEMAELKNLLRARSAAGARMAGSVEKADCASTTHLRG